MVDMEIGRKLCYTKDETKLARWCRVLTSKTEEEFRFALGDDLMEKDAKEVLNDEVSKYISDEPAVVLYSAYSREELERNSILADERKEGYEEGIQETKKEAAIELHKNGVSNDLITKSLHITDEELKQYIEME